MMYGRGVGGALVARRIILGGLKSERGPLVRVHPRMHTCTGGEEIDPPGAPKKETH